MEDLARILSEPIDVPYRTDKACPMSTQQSTSKRVRAGLYRVAFDGRTYTVEDTWDGDTWVWRVESMDRFHDAWCGDYETKRAAIAVIEAGLI